MKRKSLIYNLLHKPVPDLEGLVKKYQYGRYNEDFSLDKQRRMLYSTEAILKDCEKAKASTYVIPSGKKCVGLICLQKSAWDTELMGFNVGIVKHLIVEGASFDRKVKICLDLLYAAYDWFEKENIRFVFVKIPARDLSAVNALCRSGYVYMENWIHNSFDLTMPLPGLNKKYSLRTFNAKKDLECLLNFSKDAFVTQRYHADPYLSNTLAEKVYSKWILTSANSKSDRIVALNDSSKTLGFLIYTHKDLSRQLGFKFSRWKFAAIDRSERGKGVGRQLFTAALKLNLKEGCHIADSGLSMNNIHSLNLHNQVGFKVISGIVVFHLWIQAKAVKRIVSKSL